MKDTAQPAFSCILNCFGHLITGGEVTNNFIFNLFISKAIFDTPEDDPNYNPLPEERPGGFAWGEGQRLGG